MKLTIRYVFLTTASLLLCFILLCAFLLNTTSGAYLVFYSLKKFIPGTLSIQYIQGRLIGPLKLENVHYQIAGQLQASTHQLTFNWHPSTLWVRKLKIDQLSTDGLNIHIIPSKQSITPVKSAPLPANIDLTHIMPMSLPFGFSLHNIELRDTTFTDDDTAYTLDRIELDAHTRGRSLTHSPEIILDKMTLKEQQTVITTTAQLQTTAPFAVNLDVKAKTTFKKRAPYKGHLTALGALSNNVHLQLNSTQPFAMHATGDIQHLLYHPTADISAYVDDIGYPITDPDYQLTHGTLHLKGPLSHYQLQGNTTLLGNFLPHGTASLNSQGDLYGLQGQVNAQILDGTFSAAGTMHWLPDFTWQFKANSHQVNLQQQWPYLPDSLTFSGQSHGQYTHYWQLAANVPTLTGTYNTHPLKGNLYYTLDHDNQTARTQLHIGDTNIHLNAQYAQQWQTQWDINVPKLNTLLNDTNGALISTGTITGNRKTPHIKATLQANDLKWQHYRLHQLDQNIDVDLANEAPFKWQTRVDQFQYKTYQLNHIGLQAAGSKIKHHGQLTLTSPTFQTKFNVTGQYVKSLWQGKLLQAAIQTQQPNANWRLSNPVSIELGQSRINISPSCLLSNQNSRICVNLVHNQANAWQGKFSLSQLPLSTFSALLENNQYQTTGMLNANATIQRNAQGITIGQGQLTLSKGQLSLQTSNISEPTNLHFNNSQVTFHIDKKGLNSALQLNLTQNQFIHFDLNLPDYQGQTWPTSSQPMTGRLKTHVTDLNNLSVLFPNFTHIQGELNTDIAIGHQLGNPDIIGFSRLKNGNLFIVPLGIDVQHINVNMNSTRAGQLDWQSHFTSGGGTITATGQTQLQDANMTTHCRITGKQFEVIHNSEYQANISPDLQIVQTPKRLDINGTLTIPSANIYPTNISTTVSLPDETVIINPHASIQKNTPTLPDLYANIHLILGDNIKIDALGLKSNVSGDLKITALPEGEPTAIGHLQLNKGEYNLFGKTLTVDKGRLTFHGENVSNPNLNIQASKSVLSFDQSTSTTNDNVTVGVRITGTADNPDIALFSDPSGLDDHNILSYLLLGKPSDQISVTDSALIIQALDALRTGQYSTNSITGHLQKTLGLDELSIGQVTEYDPSAGGNVSNTGVILGKALSPKLYVSYSVGLFSQMNVFRVRYALGRGFSVQATSSSLGSGGDVLYSFHVS